MKNLNEMGILAKRASLQLMHAGCEKEAALLACAKALTEKSGLILKANQKDILHAKEEGLAESFIDRLRLDKARILDMAQGMRCVAEETDPVGRVLSGETRPNKMRIEKITVPIGVIGIIFESRPNVTSDAAALCVKAGSAVILRGGKEALHSNLAITRILQSTLKENGLPESSVQLIEDTSRDSAKALMELTKYLDVLIPRGGAGLINAVKQHSKVPVIETGVGNCHAYLDASADIDMAIDIIYNGKTTRPSVCNALETLLVHKDIAKEALPLIKARLDEKNVEIRGDEKTLGILPQGCIPATEEDWSEEFLNYILAVKVVDSLEQAISHIQKYSSGHSEVIITKNLKNAEKFVCSIDSAAVYINASTRFTDGGEFGIGAEIGISTQKLHARGPMGLNQLVSYKFIIRGDGQIR